MSATSFNVNDQSSAKRLPQYVAGLAAAGGAFAVGYGLGWSSPAGIPLIDGEYFPMSKNEFSWISSIITIGAAISCLPIGILMKMFGRKWTMIGLVIPFTIGWSLVIWAQNFAMMFTGRFFIGLAGGAFCISAPQYTAEIAEKDIRGTLGSFFQLMIVTGILFVYLIGALVNVFWLSIIGGIIPLVFGLIFFFMPESPTYLVASGKDPTSVFEWLRGSGYDSTMEIQELKDTLQEDSKTNSSFGEIVSKKNNQRALEIGFGLMLFQQLAGINVVIFYSTIIFDAADSGLSANLSTIIIGIMQLLATFASTVVVDRLGRKLLLLISIVSMIICLVLLGVFFFLQADAGSNVDSLGWLPLTSLSIYIITFSLGFGPIPWLMLGEVYSNELKPLFSPITGSFNWFLAFLITYFFESLSNAIGIGETFWLFAGLSVFGVLFCFFRIQETKGKSLQEIQRMLAGEKFL